MKILVTGADGLLGNEVVNTFSKKKDVVGFGRKGLDISVKEQVNKVISEIKPELVINTAAYTNVDIAETERIEAIETNAFGPLFIAEACDEIGAKLIHISTDYVFRGDQNGYAENYEDFRPINCYGFTKSIGEKNAKEHLEQCYIVRTSAIFGVGGKNLFSKALSIAKENKTLRIVDDQRRNPTYVKDLAQMLPDLLEREYGIYHITNSRSCTPAEFVEELVKQEGLETEVIRITSEEANSKAKRPVNSILINTKLPSLRPWQDALREYLTEVKVENQHN